MNQHHPCDTFVLEDLLHDDCDLTEQLELEKHLEHCTKCQAELTRLAADENLWTQAASHLSTVDQIELPDRLASKLSNSTSFVVPTLASDAQSGAAHPGFVAEQDWTRILDPPSHPEMLGRIDQFEVESKIGQGGMGIVLKGFDRELNRAVAIKVLSPHLAANGTARKRFAREAESAAAVMHPNVVPIYSVNSSPSRPYIVMQLVSGHSLQSLVQEKGPLDPKDVVRVSMQVAAGLDAAHKQGLIHRDVKPGNVLIERDVTRVMITDFGLARAVDDAGMTQTGWLAGTPHYMSPEQSKGDDLDARTDLFSLGSLMFFLATGREPFRGDKPYAVIQKIINRAPTQPREINADIPTTLSDVIEKLLEKDPKNRFQSANEVSQVLEQYLAHLQHPTTAAPPKRILTSRRKRCRLWMAGGLASLIGVSVLASSVGPILFSPKTSNSAGTSTTGSSSSTAFTGEQPVPIRSEPPNPFPVPAVPGLMFNDSEFSQNLGSASKELDQLEFSLDQSPFLELEREGEDFASTLQRDSELIQNQLKRFESSFEPDKSVQELLRQTDKSPEKTGENTPNPQLPTKPQLKGKLDED